MWNYRRKIWFILVSIFFISLLVVLRLFYLQVVKYSFYRSYSEEQRQKIINIAADRGEIFDRNGNLFASSIDCYSVYAVPKQIREKEKTAIILGKILGENSYKILNNFYKDRHFVWITRKIDKSKKDKIESLKLDGIYVLSEKKRVYPKGKLASQVIGFVGLDNQGLSGIEFSFDEYLRGIEGKYITESDPHGREIFSARVKEIQPAISGLNVTLSIDEFIQYISERELEKVLKSSKADSGCIVVLDTETGDILALASKPDFDPNNYLNYPPKNWIIKAVQDVYEPGSTFKVITVASALEEGAITPSTKFYCPFSISVGGKTIRNSHPRREYEPENALPKEILAYSINTGSVQVALRLGPEKFLKHIKNFGFGKHTNIGIPGETRGIVKEISEWAKSDIAMISFGQSIAVTPLQMAVAFSAIANDGIIKKPRLIKKIEGRDGSYLKVFPEEEIGRAISEGTAKEIKEMLKYVVDKGTGKFAKIKYFTVGGKTGTAQKVKPGSRGYWSGHYISSFIGIVPISKPKLVILVSIDDPKGIIWAERVAAPVFAKVAEDVLRYLNVPPDEDIPQSILREF